LWNGIKKINICVNNSLMEKNFFKIITPVFLLNIFKNNPEFRKITANINWLFLDRFVQMGVAFFVGIWVVRYLGPEKYGMLSYAVAFVALFGFIAKLGMDEIIVREFVKNPEKKGDIFGTSVFLRLIAGFLAVAFSLVAVFFVKQGDFLVFGLTLIIALGFIFQVSDVIDFWFQSQVKSRYVVYVKNFVNIAFGLIKISLILLKAPLIFFALVILFESIIILIGFIFIFLKNKKDTFNIKINLSLGKQILSDSWPLILAGAAVSIYMKIDQVMIGSMLDNKSLGIYSAAVSLCEMWYFFPVIVTASVFPAIIYSKKISRELFINRMQMLYDFLTWVAIAIAVVATLFSKHIVGLLFGEAYIQSASVLAIYIWAGIFVSMGVASGKYWVVENLTKISLFVTFFGALINVLLNLWFIPIFGIIGASVATLVSYFISGMIFITLFKQARIVFKMQISALNIFRFFGYIRKIVN